MRLPDSALRAHLTCRSGFVTCREEAVLVMSLPGLLGGAVPSCCDQTSSKHTRSFVCSTPATEPGPRDQDRGEEGLLRVHVRTGCWQEAAWSPASLVPVRSSVSPLWMWMAGDTRRSWAEPAHRVATVDGIGVDGERPNEKVALPQARLTSCEVIGTHRQALQFPRHLDDLPPPFSRRHQAERRTNPSYVPRLWQLSPAGLECVWVDGHCRVLKPRRVPLPSLSLGGRVTGRTA